MSTNYKLITLLMKTLFLIVITSNYACASKVEKGTLTEKTDNLLKLWNAFNFDMSLSRAGLHIQLGNPGARGNHEHQIDGTGNRDADGGMAPSSASSSGHQTSGGATYQPTVAGQMVHQVVPPGQVSVQQPAQVIHFMSGLGQGSELGGRSESGLKGSSESGLNGRSAETGSAGQQKMDQENVTGRSPEASIPVKVAKVVPYIEPPNIPFRPKATQPLLLPYPNVSNIPSRPNVSNIPSKPKVTQPLLLPYPNVYIIDHKPHVLVPLPVTHPFYKDHKSFIVFPTEESPMSGTSMAGLPKVDLKNGKVSTSGDSTSEESTSEESADESSSVLESTAVASKLIQSKFEQSKNQLSAFSIPNYKSSTSNHSVFVTKIMAQSSF